MTALTHFSGPIPGTSISNFMRSGASPIILMPNACTVATYVDPVRTPRYVPIRLNRAYKIVAMGLEVTANGAADEAERLGIYMHDNVKGGPTRLLREVGVVTPNNPATTGLKEIAIVPLVLMPDIYWLCCVTDCSGTVSTKRSYGGTSALNIQRTAPPFGLVAGFTGPLQSAGDNTIPGQGNNMPPYGTTAGTSGTMVRMYLKGVAL